MSFIRLCGGSIDAWKEIGLLKKLFGRGKRLRIAGGSRAGQHGLGGGVQVGGDRFGIDPKFGNIGAQDLLNRQVQRQAQWFSCQLVIAAGLGILGVTPMDEMR